MPVLPPGRMSGQPSDGVAYLISALTVLGLIVAIVALVPVACAIVIFFVARRWLAGRDWAIVAAAGLVGFVWNLADNVIGYGSWLLSFINVGDASPRQAPITVLLCLTALLAGLGGMAAGAAVPTPANWALS